MSVANDAFLINQDCRRPCPDAIALPVVKTVVLNDGVADFQFGSGCFNFPEGSFPWELGRMDTDDREAISFVLVIPAPQLRDDVFTIDSAVGPEFD